MTLTFQYLGKNGQFLENKTVFLFFPLTNSLHVSVTNKIHI